MKILSLTEWQFISKDGRKRHWLALLYFRLWPEWLILKPCMRATRPATNISIRVFLQSDQISHDVMTAKQNWGGLQTGARRVVTWSWARTGRLPWGERRCHFFLALWSCHISSRRQLNCTLLYVCMSRMTFAVVSQRYGATGVNVMHATNRRATSMKARIVSLAKFGSTTTKTYVEYVPSKWIGAIPVFRCSFKLNC